MTETWLPVVGYEGLYEVSDLGRVRSLDRMYTQRGNRGSTFTRRLDGRILKATVGSRGYRMVALCFDSTAWRGNVATLVATAFHGARPEGLVVDHINGVRTDDRAANLRWVTYNVNARNRHKPKGDNPYVNVSRRTGERYEARPWRASLATAPGVKVELGMFATAEEARDAVAAFKKTSTHDH